VYVRVCKIMGVNRSSFYKWKHRLEHPSKRMQSFVADPDGNGLLSGFFL